MNKYKCDICGKNHDVYYHTTGAIPEKVFEIRTNGDSSRIDEIDDFILVLDKSDVFLKGLITLETRFTEDPITHEAWIEIPVKDYLSHLEENKNNPLHIIHGTIASALPFYQNMLGLNAKWVLDGESQSGQIFALSDGELKEDQQEPITKARMQKIMEIIHHPELHREQKTFCEPFDKRIREAIQQAKIKFKDNNKKFLIDISNLKGILFQLIPGEMTEIEGGKEIGLHLSIDKNHEEYDFVKRKLDEFCRTHKVINLQLDEIETYQKNYNFNDEVLIQDVQQIIETVFEENLEKLSIEISEM